MKQKAFTLGIVLLILQLIYVTKGYSPPVRDVIVKINQERFTEMNIFLNLELESNDILDEDFGEAVHHINHIPKLVKTRSELIAPVQKIFTENLLAIVWITWESLNATLAVVDRLLWQLHFKDILLVYHHPSELNRELQLIFQLCWKYGFTSLLLWSDRQLYTYHPYPAVVIKVVDNISEFSDKSHLNNFQRYCWKQPQVEFPPRYFSYRNRQGQLIRTGHVYKIIEKFIAHHNGCFKYYFFDMWTQNNTLEYELQILMKKGFAFGHTILNYNENTLPSNSLYLARVGFVVPSPREIPESLYLVIPFDDYVWWLILFCGFLFYILLNIISFLERGSFIWGDYYLQAFQVIIFRSISTINVRTFRNYALTLLCLFTGLFLTNYYSTSLSSMHTAKVYRPPLRTLKDIEKTNLFIYEYSSDLTEYDHLENLPPIIHQRLYAANNTELLIYRQNLNMTYIYRGLEDLLDYILFQQTYLDRPIAQKLDEPLLYRPFFLHLQHRSPLFEQFNRYLSHIRDSGLMNKFLLDAYWDGILSGNLKFFTNPEAIKPLAMPYFNYAFLILMCGLTSAFVSFIMENVWKRLKMKKPRSDLRS